MDATQHDTHTHTHTQHWTLSDVLLATEGVAALGIFRLAAVRSVPAGASGRHGRSGSRGGGRGGGGGGSSGDGSGGGGRGSGGHP